ncbi:hypothetical protein ABNF65_11915 [Paenibacillus larvae]
MKQHYNRLDFRQYIEDNLEETRRHELETHLYRCDLCLSMYMKELELSSLPPISTAPGPFMDDVVEQIQRMNSHAFRKQSGGISRPAARKTKPNQRKQFMIHYAVAAAATFILVVSGAFYGFGGLDDHPASPQKKPTSVSDKVMEKTVGLLDSFQTNPPKGGTNR